MINNSVVTSIWIQEIERIMPDGAKSNEWEEVRSEVGLRVGLANENVRYSLILDWVLDCFSSRTVLAMVPEGATESWLSMIEHVRPSSILAVCQNLSVFDDKTLRDVLFDLRASITASNDGQAVVRAVMAVELAFSGVDDAVWTEEVNPVKLLRELNGV